jgi:hypothetical protein
VEECDKFFPTHLVERFGKLCFCWESEQIKLIHRWGQRTFRPVCHIGGGSVVIKIKVIRLNCDWWGWSGCGG